VIETLESMADVADWISQSDDWLQSRQPSNGIDHHLMLPLRSQEKTHRATKYSTSHGSLCRYDDALLYGDATEDTPCVSSGDGGLPAISHEIVAQVTTRTWQLAQQRNAYVASILKIGAANNSNSIEKKKSTSSPSLELQLSNSIKVDDDDTRYSFVTGVISCQSVVWPYK
jgi:hypothetical protein